METAYEFLKESKIFFVATVSKEEPRIRPFGFVMKRNGKLYFCTSKRKEIYSNLLENPKIEICIVSRDHKKWLRIRGIVQFDETEATKAQVFEQAPYLLTLYPKGKNDEIFLTFFIEEGTAKLFSVTGEVQEIPLL